MNRDGSIKKWQKLLSTHINSLQKGLQESLDRNNEIRNPLNLFLDPAITSETLAGKTNEKLLIYLTPLKGGESITIFRQFFQASPEKRDEFRQSIIDAESKKEKNPDRRVCANKDNCWHNKKGQCHFCHCKPFSAFLCNPCKNLKRSMDIRASQGIVAHSNLMFRERGGKYGDGMLDNKPDLVDDF